MLRKSDAAKLRVTFFGRKVVKNRTCCRRYPNEIVIFAIESSGGVPPGDLHTEGTHYGGALKTAKF